LAIDPNISKSKTKVDLVKAVHPPLSNGRNVKREKINSIEKVAKNLTPEEANFEFTGIFYFSKEGFRIFQNAYKELSISQKGVGIWEVFDFLVKSGISIKGLEVTEGWIEIRNYENYKAAHSMLT